MEARFKGKGKFYPGTITRANPDGATFSVRFDDGDADESVTLANISAFARPGQFSVGDQIEARFGGKGTFYKGEVIQDRGDGTYAVRYEDGDIEENVKFVRLPLA